MNQKAKKGFSILLDVVLALLVIIILTVAISSLSSKDKGYTSFLGKAVYAAKTDSMKGNKPDSFDKNALIFSKVLNDEEKRNLKVGDVITFKTVLNGQWELNTHRIVYVIDGGGANAQYKTRGDNTPANDPGEVFWREVVAKYDSKIEGLGAFVNFSRTSMGFFAIIVLPSVGIFIYCIFAFVNALKRITSEKAEAEKAKRLEEEKAKEKEAMRLELLAEMEKEKAKQEKDKT